ncbi:competence type IV pilus minor pilin ComGF [Alkalihalobacillus sp. BA299]|uniref:competence type IV pilus minor pilin ComGF n=1 Tax=Alkalihalobacillus sp. BA299 TaxID=2815938 RepID=UPI001ADCAF05|nr:competence type IV pilus minor pilin ComGF [Alkalihalobacillus sp. BA299]
MWPCKKINEKGFTLIEVILAFIIFLILVSLFPLIIKVIPIILPPTEQPHMLQVELFFNQFSMEVREAEDIQVTGSAIYLSKPNETIVTIERYGTMIRRRVNGQGHEVFLRHISTVSFKLAPHGVVVTIVDSDGTKYERRFSMV